MTGPPSDTVGLVVRRADLLGELQAGARTKPELVDRLPVSRSTVDRAVRSLEAHGLVSRDDAVSLTPRGRIALDAHESFADAVGALGDAGEVLSPLPVDATIDTALLEGATVVDPNRDAPERATTAVIEEVESATEIRGFASTVLPSTVEVFHDAILDGAIMDHVVASSVLDDLLSEHADPVHRALDTGRFRIREATTELAYSLLLFEHPDRTVVVALVYGDRGLSGVVKNDSEAAVAWAERVYADLREAATPLPT